MASLLRKKFFKKMPKLKKENTVCIADYDETFAIPKKVLSIVGIQMAHGLSEIQAKYWNYLSVFTLVNFWLSCVGEFLDMIMSVMAAKNFRDATEVFKTVPCFSINLLAIIKVMKIKNNRTTFENMHHTLREMWPTRGATEEEYLIIREKSKQLNFIVKVYCWCNNALILIFVTPSLLTYMKRYLGYDAPPTLAFEYWLHFDLFQPGVYEFILLNQSYTAFVVIWFYISWDMLFFVYISHITIQFELLSRRVHRLIYVPVDQQLIDSFMQAKDSKGMIGDDCDHHVLNSYNGQNYEIRQQKDLADIINTHHVLIRLSEDVEAMFSIGLLINMMTSSMMICFCGFCSVMIEKWNEFAYKSFFATALVQTFLVCWYGQKLVDHSLGFSQSLYECGWYNASKKTKSSILLMLMRTQKGVRVTTYGFSTVSLSSYSKIIKTSWSYFTLLLNFYLGSDAINDI